MSSEYDPSLPPWEATRALRARATVAFARKCEYCGSQVSYRHGTYNANVETLDRIIPGAKGGEYVASNVTLACLRCNQKKSKSDFIGPVRSLAIMEALG